MSVTVQSRLDAIARSFDNRVEAAIHVGAGRIKQRAQERVPVDEGRLRDAIHVEATPLGAYVIAGDNKAFYGHMIEHGTTHTPPRPFLIPALEESRDDLMLSIAAALRDL
jgi:HK97 gp10 family phage protein